MDPEAMNTSIDRRGWCLVPNTLPDSTIDLQEVANRNDAARHIIAGFSTAIPTLTEIWRHLESALDDTPALSAEITRLTAELRDTRLDRANLVAAARATLSASLDGESDPLSYLRDELTAPRDDEERP
jgi:non-ribosomal peptide synthetase component F